MMAGSSVASKVMWTTCLLHLVSLQRFTPQGYLLSGLPSESQHGSKVGGGVLLWAALGRSLETEPPTGTRQSGSDIQSLKGLLND